MLKQSTLYKNCDIASNQATTWNKTRHMFSHKHNNAMIGKIFEHCLSIIGQGLYTMYQQSNSYTPEVEALHMYIAMQCGQLTLVNDIQCKLNATAMWLISS